MLNHALQSSQRLPGVSSMATAAKWLQHAKLRGESMSLRPVTTLAITFTCVSIQTDVKVVLAQGIQTRIQGETCIQK